MRLRLLTLMVLGCTAVGFAQATAQPESNKPESLRDRASYVIGFNLGDYLKAQKRSVGPEQVEQGLLDALSGDSTASNQQKMWDESYVIGFNLGKSLKEQRASVDPKLIVRGLLDGLSGASAALSQQEMWDAMQAFPFRQQYPANQQQAVKTALSTLKKIGDEVRWVEHKKIDSDDCITIPFVGTTCHTVTYKFEFRGRVTRVDSEGQTYTVSLTSRKVVPQEMVSPMYWTYKDRAQNWADQQEDRMIEIKYVQ